MRSLVGKLTIFAVLCACTGPDAISIGAQGARGAADGGQADAGRAGATFFISPAGADRNPGTRALPWRTFAASIPRLAPGDTLVLLDGTYAPTGAGPVDIRCGTNAANGTESSPITLRADHERVALLKGDGITPPFFMQGCSYWFVEGLHAESVDLETPTSMSDAGSVFLLGNDNHYVTLRRLLGAHPNRYYESHGLRIADRSSDVVVEECEIYDFNHNAFETQRSSSVVFRRDYANPRGVQDVPGGFSSAEPLRGHVGFFLEETRFAVVEDSIVEGTRDGFVFAGRNPGFTATVPPPAPDPIDGNEVVGSVASNTSGSGFAVASTCGGQNPCADRTRIVAWTQFVDDVAIGGFAGVQSTGGVGTSIREFTAIGAASGITTFTSADNVGLTADSFSANALVIAFRTGGFASSGEANWGFDHCDPSGGVGAAYSPDDKHVTNPVSLSPALGGCLVYLPPGSPLKGAGAQSLDVGANVVARHVDGVASSVPLWNPSTGAFPCGAFVPGVNDDPTTSCGGVHQRLHVGVSGCPLP